MIDDILNIDSVTEIYVISNNGTSLARGLSNDSSVKELATRVNSQQLADEFSSLINREIASYETIAKLYSIYVALTFRPKAEAEFFFDAYENLLFEWFPILRKILYKKAESTSIITIDAPNNVNLIRAVTGNTTSGNSSNMIILI